MSKLDIVTDALNSGDLERIEVAQQHFNDSQRCECSSELIDAIGDDSVKRKLQHRLTKREFTRAFSKTDILSVAAALGLLDGKKLKRASSEKSLVDAIYKKIK